MVDEEKIKALTKLCYVLPISKPAILLHAGDDFCWIQYHMLKFLELDAIILIPEENELALGKVPDNFWIYRYKDKKELEALTLKAIKRYEKKVMQNG